MTYFYGPLHAGGRSSAAGVFCKTCQKETGFFRHKCLVCGTAYVKQTQKGGKQTWKYHVAVGRRLAAIKKDKAEHSRRMAEESRRKWESTAPAQKNLPEKAVGDEAAANFGKCGKGGV